MEIRLLGPVEAYRDGRRVDLPDGLPKRLLTLLALNVGRVVPVSQLAVQLWDEPPSTAHRQISNRVSMLRRVVDPEVVERVGSGYRLRAETVTVDVHEFRVETARARRPGTDPASARRMLAEALRWWRGPALAGLTGRELAIRADSLDAERLSVIDDLAELEIGAGHHRAAAERLRRTLAEAPHRQRSADLLMLALYRDGEPAAALRVFDELRDRLTDDLGLDPDPRLEQRRVSILRNDSSVRSETDSAATDPPRRPTTPVPAQLPADPASFTGRDAEIAALDAGPDPDRVVVICGPGGAGKTALALRWAHRARPGFPDGQLYINLRGFDQAEPVSAHAALERFLVALGVSGPAIPADVDSASALFRSVVADRRLLVVLDNARDVDQVRPLLSGGDRNRVIVTSRHRLTGLTVLDHARRIRLGALDPDQSRALLAGLLGAGRVAAESEAADRLARLCAGLPLALRIAAANLLTNPDWSIAAHVSELDTSRRLSLLTVHGDSAAAVATTFGHSLRVLDAESRRVFLTLGLIPGEDFPEALVAGLIGVELAPARRLLHRLEDAHLLEQHRPGRYRFHDLVRLYAQQQAAKAIGQSEQDEISGRYIDWHYRLYWLSADESVNILSAHPALVGHRRFWMLAASLHYAVNAGHAPARTRQVITDAYRRIDPADEPCGHTQLSALLGAWHRTNGELGEAVTYGRAAMATAETVDDGISIGLAKGGYALTLRQLGRYREAEELLKEDIAIAIEVDVPTFLELSHYNLGALYREMGRFADALAHLRHAERIEAGAPAAGQAILHRLDLAGVHMDTGNLSAAQSELDAARRLRDGFDMLAESLHRRVQGELVLAKGDPAEARNHFVLLKELALRNRMPAAEIEARSELVTIECRLGNLDAARDEVAALVNHDAVGYAPIVAAAAAAGACAVHIADGEPALAVPHAERAARLYHDMPRPLREAEVLCRLATAHDALGRHDLAERNRTAARDIRRGIGAAGV